MQTNAKKRDAALEEVRTAVEDLVLAGGHAAELLPRSPDVMQAQACFKHSAYRTCIAVAFWKWDLSTNRNNFMAGGGTVLKQ